MRPPWGLTLVITDHHLPPSTLPTAVAVVDPRRQDDHSPFKELCGAGVAFKLCAALEDCMPEELLEFCSDLAAIGTVADRNAPHRGEPHHRQGGAADFCRTPSGRGWPPC